MSEAPSVTNEAVTARVVAVHKETSIVRGPDDSDRPAIVSGRFRFEPWPRRTIRRSVTG